MQLKFKRLQKRIWPFSLITNRLNELYREINHLNKTIISQNEDYNLLNNKLSDVLNELEHKNKEIDTLNSIIHKQALTIDETKNMYNRIFSDLENSRSEISRLQHENKRLNALLQVNEAKAIHLHSDEFWDSIYSQKRNSGTGSSGYLAQFKADIVNQFLKTNNVKTVIELGCGDGNQLSLINYEDYTGVDVSPYIIEKLKEKFADDKSKHFYCSLTDRDKYINKKYDVSISMDVIFHLLEENTFENYMEDLFSLSNRYVIIYSSNHEEYTRWPEYRHRNFMGYIQQYISGWELEKLIPNKYPYVIGREEETSASDFYIFKKIS